MHVEARILSGGASLYVLLICLVAVTALCVSRPKFASHDGMDASLRVTRPHSHRWFAHLKHPRRPSNEAWEETKMYTHGESDDVNLNAVDKGTVTVKPIAAKSQDEQVMAALGNHDHAFEAYITKYGKHYTPEEKPQRKANHKACLEAAHARNLRISKLRADPEEKQRFVHGAPETHGETIFCDLTLVIHVRANEWCVVHGVV